MKRTQLLLSLILIPFIGLYAQEKVFKPRFMMGPTGGVNLSSIIFQPNVQQTLKLGYDGGVVFRYDATSYAGIWLEVDYSARGWREKPEEYPDYFYDRSLRFINVPIMTNFMLGNGAFKLTINAGSHFGYYFSESSTTNFPNDTSEWGLVTEQHEMPVENKFAWGIGGGLGFEYHFPKIVAGVRGSYYYGLGEIYDNSRKDFFGKSSEQVIAVKAYLLYTF